MDGFEQQIQAMQARVDSLAQRARTASAWNPELLREALDELAAGMEELHVAAEELHDQSQELLDAHQALEVEHQYYQDLFTFAPDAYLVTTPRGIIQEANHAAATLLNTAQPYLIGQRLVLYVAADDQQAFRAAVAQLRGSDRVQTLEVRIQPRGHAPIDAAVRVATVRDRLGTQVALRWLLRDITERKRAEEDRRQILAREQAARAMAEAAAAQVKRLQSITDAALVHLGLDDLLHELLCRVRESLVADTAAILLIEAGGDTLVARAALGLEEAVARGLHLPIGKGFAGRIAAERKPMIIPDLDQAEVLNPLLAEKGLRSLLGVPLVAEGEVIGVVHVGTLHPRVFTPDDTQLLQLAADRMALAIVRANLDAAMRHELEQRQRAEQALDAMNEQLQAILRAAPMAVIVVDPAGLVRLWNLAAENLFGWHEHEILGCPMPTVTDDQQRAFQEILARVGAGETIAGRTVRSRRRDRTQIDLLLSVAPLPGASGSVAGMMFLMIDLTELEEVRASRAQLQILSHRLLSAQEDERRYIARELHDEIGQALTLIKLSLEVARDEPNRAIDLALDESLSLVKDTLQRVRNLALDLHPAVLDDLGLVAALRWYLDRQAYWSGLTTSFRIEGRRARLLESIRLPHAIEIACFRTAQEALTNVTRHAQARSVQVVLRVHEDELTLLVRDDGVGFNVRGTYERALGGASLGLLGMQERVTLGGGQFMIESAPGQGTTIQARFPLMVGHAG